MKKGIEKRKNQRFMVHTAQAQSDPKGICEGNFWRPS